MSFILEALRKSEAERRRGQTPDLLSEAMPVAPATRTSTDNRAWIIAILMAVLIVLLLAVWALRSTVPAESKAAVVAPPTAPATAAAVATPPLPTQTRLSPPPTRAAAPPTTRAPVPVAKPALAPTTAATATASAAPRTSESQPPATEPEITAPAAPPQVAATDPANAATFASPNAPLKLADLSTDERQQLPALKVSMHMWAPDAANRFAIIDGARVNEGDRVGDATVEAIQQDGVMLNWRGRRIRLSLR